MKKRMRSKRASKDMATTLRSPPSHCLSIVLMMQEDGVIMRGQAQAITSGWQNELNRGSLRQPLRASDAPNRRSVCRQPTAFTC